MRLSVGRRLAFLAAIEVVTVAVLLVVALISLRDVDSNVRLVKGYLIPPVNTLSTALVRNAHAQDLAASRLATGESFERAALQADWESLTRLLNRYRNEWNIASHDLGNARAAVGSARLETLVAGERAAVLRLSHALDHLARYTARVGPPVSPGEAIPILADIQSSLRDLRNLNTELLEAFQSSLEAKVAAAHRVMLFTGGAGTLIAAWAALRVRLAIAPRIRRLVHVVERFRDTGVYEHVRDAGQDDIAILSNAIDAGLTSIAERDRERERFLATASHQLKTPLASLVGFAQVANAHPNRPDLSRRALEVIERQSLRLVRLTDEVFLAARARANELPVRPQPMDLALTVRKALDEVSKDSGRTIFLETPPTAGLFADPDLLTHCVWALLSHAVAMAVPSEPIRVKVWADAPKVKVRVDFRPRDPAGPEIDRALSPFGSVAHEGAGVHAGVGLYLPREIARLHGGSLHIEGSAVATSLCLELST